MTTGPAPSAAPLRVRTERRRRPFVAGIVAAVVGLALLVAGGVLMNVAAGSVVIDGKRAPFGTPIEFDAEDTSYRLILVRYGVTETILERELAATDCVATFADGSTATVDGARQGVAESTSTGLSIGSFDAVEGPASVVCTKSTGPGSPLARYALAEDRPAMRHLSYGLMAAGLLAGAAAVALIVVGVRGRAVIEPTPPPPA